MAGVYEHALYFDDLERALNQYIIIRIFINMILT